MGNVILATADSHAGLVYPLRQMTDNFQNVLFVYVIRFRKCYKRIAYKVITKQTVNWDVICTLFSL